MTDDDLEVIRQRSEKATRGPWRSMIEGRDHTSGDSFIMVGEGPDRSDDIYVSFEGRAAPELDQDFIAAARQDIPILLAEIDRLRGLLSLTEDRK